MGAYGIMLLANEEFWLFGTRSWLATLYFICPGKINITEAVEGKGSNLTAIGETLKGLYWKKRDRGGTL